MQHNYHYCMRLLNSMFILRCPSNQDSLKWAAANANILVHDIVISILKSQKSCRINVNGSGRNLLSRSRVAEGVCAHCYIIIIIISMT